MGLFSFLSDEDPNAQAQLAMAAGLLGGRGSFNQILSGALTQGQKAGAVAGGIQRQADLDRLAKQRFQLALDEEARKKKQFDALEAFRASIPSPESTAIASLGGNAAPTQANAAQLPPVDPLLSLSYKGMKAGAIDPMEWLKSQQKNKTPIKLEAGATLLNPETYKPIASAPEKQGSEIQQYEYAQKQGYPGSFTQWSQEQKKAGASNTSIKIDNALGGGLAKQVAELAGTGQQQASGAIQQMQTSDSIIKAIDSNQVLAGPGASLRLKGLQIGQALGITGKDSNETISNTRSAIQGLAQSTVAARSALKGQGQVSDFEGRLLEKANSGNIDDLTAGEIRQIAVLNKKLSEQLVKQHKVTVERIRGNKNPEISGLADYFDVNMPGQSMDWKDLGR